jgi:RimJ/RimL family protein N-acetyltransferase
MGGILHVFDDQDPQVSSSFSLIGRDLVTDRLILRPWPPDEVSAVSDGNRFPHWAEDFPAEGDQDIAAAMAKHVTWLGEFGHRQMIERDSGRVTGSLGLFWPPINGTVEIGYGVVASRRGRGYAPEAARALTAFAFTAPEVTMVYARVEPGNTSSIRVLEKAGFQKSMTEIEGNILRYHAVPPA